jgi:hypothetical protein
VDELAAGRGAWGLFSWSTTGASLADAWPIKPDVVLEGGTAAKNSKGEIEYPLFEPRSSAFARGDERWRA